jgi:hypothetical protein
VAPPYNDRAARFAGLAAAQATLSRRYSRARLAVAAVAIVAGIGWLGDPSRAWPVPVFLGALGAFVVLAVRHERVEERREELEGLAALNFESQQRVERAWSARPLAWRVEGIDDHPYAGDLDLFGHASLAETLGPVRTPTGRVILTRWLLDGPDVADPDTIARRHEAVRELSPQLEFRQRLTVAARRIPALDPVPWRAPRTGEGTADGTSILRGEPPLVRFITWTEEPSWLLERPWIPVAAVLLGLSATGLFVAWLGGLVASPWWLAVAMAGWVLRYAVRHPIERALAGAAGEYGLRSWTALIAHVGRTGWTSAELRGARAALTSGGGAEPALRRLEQLVALADFRLSTWLYLFIQSFTLWELHVWWAIERWRAAHGRHVADWLHAVGTVEALASLGALAGDHPDWTYPDVSPAHDRLEASGLGHPLLAEGVRVANDVALGPPGRFLLITGSNMSGKSTLLRSIGVNVVLAHAGAPVCARRMTLPPLALHASMRVADSLERGLSLFMASLVRLERIVRTARDARSRMVCYLLDEVLQGTNSAERQVAVRTVIGHLLSTLAIGAVTTHDLELARDPAFSANADSFHLQETLVRQGDAVTMTFDYMLRPGPAQAGNALELLRMLGLQ